MYCLKSLSAWLLTGVVILSAQAPFALAKGEADRLLGLTPKDSSVTFALEGPHEHLKAILESKPAQTLKNLPAVRRWMGSSDFRNATAALDDLKSLLGDDLEAGLQKLLGKGVVLSLKLPASGDSSEPRGLLLTEVADRKALVSLIQKVNAHQKGSGELVGVDTRTHLGATYTARTFRDETKRPEWYVLLASGVFAWSNSEESIREVIEREAKSDGLAGRADFKGVRDHLPDDSFASLFIDPRSAESLLKTSSPPATPEEARVIGLNQGYLAALKYVGSSLSWKDGPRLCVEESIDFAKLDPDLRGWGLPPSSEARPVLRMLPPTAIAVADLSIDPVSASKLLLRLSGLEDSPRLSNLWVALDGLLLGMNAREELIPKLGPEVVAYVERPEVSASSTWRWPAVLMIALPSDPDSPIGPALVNGLRTVLALTALDEKRQKEGLRVISKPGSASLVTFLEPFARFAFAQVSGRFIAANSPEAVERALASASVEGAGKRFRDLQTRFLEGPGSFFCIDLRSLREFASKNREPLARRFALKRGRAEVEVSEDLERVLELISPFEAAYFTSRVELGFLRVHRTLGLLAAP